MITKEKIQQKATAYFDDTIEIRRHIHKYPELSFEEYKTSAYIVSKLEAYGIPYKTGFVKTGIIADIVGEKPLANGAISKVIALRADMDALPIEEANEVSYCSVNKGVMHACGHDVHAANLLTTARILNELKSEFSDTIRLVFQPGEERCPGGARLMLEEGALADNEPEMIAALHVLPELENGKVGFKSGMYMASTDEINIIVEGKGGHGAIPHQLTDNILIASHIIVALQQIASRNAPAGIPTVLSFGKIIANGSTNIIPDKVEIMGTFRTMNEEWRAQAQKNMKQIAQGMAKAMGANCKFKVVRGYPFLVNDAKVTEIAKNAAIKYLGEDKVMDMGLRMTGEDFSFYAQKYPSTFFRLGVGTKDQDSFENLHSSTFDINEKALLTGPGIMAWVALSYLGVAE